MRIKGNDIIFRSTLGITRKYSFNDITRASYKESGALRVYAGKKRIFTFDDNMDCLQFTFQLSELGIPIELNENMTMDDHIIRPLKVYPIILGIMTLLWGVLTIYTSIAGTASTPLYDVLVRIRILTGGRKEFELSEIDGICVKKNIFRENLVLHSGTKRLTSIWTRNRAIELLRARLAKDKIPYIKRRRKNMRK